MVDKECLAGVMGWSWIRTEAGQRLGARLRGCIDAKKVAQNRTPSVDTVVILLRGSDRVPLGCVEGDDFWSECRRKRSGDPSLVRGIESSFRHSIIFYLFHLDAENLGAYLYLMCLRGTMRCDEEDKRTFLMCSAARSTPKSLLRL